MLILLRKVGEEIVIGGEIFVSVARVTRTHVSLAITAPASVGVNRKEIWSAKKRDRDTAGSRRSGELSAGSGETRQA